jgi:hypothetical protein
MTEPPHVPEIPEDIFDDDGGTVRWFGPSWGAMVNTPHTYMPPPAGATCLLCTKAFTPGDRGIGIPGYEGPDVPMRYGFYHLYCWTLTISGTDVSSE